MPFTPHHHHHHQHRSYFPAQSKCNCDIRGRGQDIDVMWKLLWILFGILMFVLAIALTLVGLVINHHLKYPEDYFKNYLDVTDPCDDVEGNGNATLKTNLIYGLGEESKIRCDTTSEGGPWLVFQRRVDNSVDFYRDWEDYREGFGDPEGNFWLGLDAIHELTKRDAIVRVDLWWGTDYSFLEWGTFHVGNALSNFTLTKGIYTSKDVTKNTVSTNTKKDIPNKLLMFSTRDRDNDYGSGCAETYKSGWWFTNKTSTPETTPCGDVNPNGVHPGSSIGKASGTDGAFWNSMRGNGDLPSKIEMKLKIYSKVDSSK